MFIRFGTVPMIVRKQVEPHLTFTFLPVKTNSSLNLSIVKALQLLSPHPLFGKLKYLMTWHLSHLNPLVSSWTSIFYVKHAGGKKVFWW